LAGNTASQAVVNFHDPMKEVLGCFLKGSVSNRLGSHASHVPHVFTIADGDPVKLAGQSQLSLAVTMHYRVVEDPRPDVGPFKVSTAKYIFELYDKAGRRVIGYHWHPDDEKSPFRSPHLHLGESLRGPNLHHKAHLPTGRVSLEEVLKLAVYSFNVEPIRGDWEKILNRTQERHEAFRSWGNVPKVTG